VVNENSQICSLEAGRLELFFLSARQYVSDGCIKTLDLTLTLALDLTLYELLRFEISGEHGHKNHGVICPIAT
jgi:hypothetical protein